MSATGSSKRRTLRNILLLSVVILLVYTSVRVLRTPKHRSFNKLPSVSYILRRKIHKRGKAKSPEPVNSTASWNNNKMVMRTLESIYDLMNRNHTKLLCDNMPPDLGPVQVDAISLSLEEVDTKYPEVLLGGHYKPPNCTARDRVAIIVPYRNRKKHLAAFLNHMHPFLMKQQLEYGLFIVEQEGNRLFNRAKLFNVGFVESRKLHTAGWHCFIFHDIDLLPLDTRNLYKCPKQPRHMSASIDAHDNKLRYYELFGGVSALTLEQFINVNGFSNRYWGWGGEDDDLFYRVKSRGYHLGRYPMSIARYTMLKHKPGILNKNRYNLLHQTRIKYKHEGLTTLEYKIIEIVQHHLYTYIYVNIDDEDIRKDAYFV